MAIVLRTLKAELEPCLNPSTLARISTEMKTFNDIEVLMWLEVLYKRAVLKNLTKFTEKDLRHGLIFKNISPFRPMTSLKTDSDFSQIICIVLNNFSL